VSAERRFAPAPASVQEARRFVGAELTDLPREVVEVAVLLVSELATNAVIHAHSAFTVEVTRRPDDVRVAVRDQGRGIPLAEHPAPTALRGRGLSIIEGLAASWGVERSEPHKTVWFTVPLRATTSGGSWTHEAPPTAR
jgi:anti-sigma regulatory factor (Ser/Thr protein kinase)